MYPYLSHIYAFVLLEWNYLVLISTTSSTLYSSSSACWCWWFKVRQLLNISNSKSLSHPFSFQLDWSPSENDLQQCSMKGKEMVSVWKLISPSQGFRVYSTSITLWKCRVFSLSEINVRFSNNFGCCFETLLTYTQGFLLFFVDGLSKFHTCTAVSEHHAHVRLWDVCLQPALHLHGKWKIM